MASTSTSFYCRPSGERLAKHSSAAPGRDVAPPGAATDSESGKSRVELRKSEIKRQALLNTLSELVFVVAKDGTILEFHAPAENDFMLSAEGLVGRSIRELLPPQFGQQAIYYVEKTLRTSQVQVVSYQFQMKTGPRQFEARVAVYDADQVIALVRDVTDRNFLEKEVLEISNREQMRIGQDLHDGLGQHLTGITFLAKALERKLAAQSRPEAGAAGEINRLVIQAISQTRSLAKGLFPVELESNGLIPAFRELAERVRQTFGVSCELACDESFVIANRAAALHLFRLAQEAISNSIRHGKARHLWISLKTDGPQHVLAIRDDGQGIHNEGARLKGLGLRIMSYRAQKIGGKLAVEPAADGGTVVSCHFSEVPETI